MFKIISNKATTYSCICPVCSSYFLNLNLNKISLLSILSNFSEKSISYEYTLNRA